MLTMRDKSVLWLQRPTHLVQQRKALALLSLYLLGLVFLGLTRSPEALEGLDPLDHRKCFGRKPCLIAALKWCVHSQCITHHQWTQVQLSLVFLSEIGLPLGL